MAIINEIIYWTGFATLSFLAFILFAVGVLMLIDFFASRSKPSIEMDEQL